MDARGLHPVDGSASDEFPHTLPSQVAVGFTTPDAQIHSAVANAPLPPAVEFQVTRPVRRLSFTTRSHSSGSLESGNIFLGSMEDSSLERSSPGTCNENMSFSQAPSSSSDEGNITAPTNGAAGAESSPNWEPPRNSDVRKQNFLSSACHELRSKIRPHDSFSLYNYEKSAGTGKLKYGQTYFHYRI